MSVFDIQSDSIESGTQIIHVRDYKLAAAMMAVGIPLRRDPPFTHVEKKDGTRIITYNFFPATEEGDITASECVEAWKRDLDFIQENPEHPFTFAMCAIKNVDSFYEHKEQHTPYVGFKVRHKEIGDAVLLVKKGSRKHQAAIKRKLKQL